jgi:2-polyprenyl-6-methoxyphenol hydroxylase-like FAD-dependent oxidoreductase
MNPGKVLIVGAGLAGSAAAWHLDRIGWEVTLADPTLNAPESYLLQLDQTAQGLLEAMGAVHVAQDISAPSPHISMRWGRRRVRRTSFSSGSFRLGPRRQIVEAMRAHVPAGVEQRLGIRLVSLELAPTGVIAVFDDGTREPYDLVVGADGINSTVRSLVHGPDSSFLHRNGLSHVWFKIPVRPPHDMAILASRENVALQIYPYPGPGTTQVLTAMQLPPSAHLRPHVVRSGVAAIVRDTGSDLMDLADAVEAADAPFLTRFTQVRMPTWSTHRTILIGDAAHCIDPLSGLGAHASLLDAAVLGDVLQTHRTFPEAFAAFDARLRPFVDASQQLTAGILEYVASANGRTRLRTVARGLGDLTRLAPHLTTRQGRGNLAGAHGLTPADGKHNRLELADGTSTS